MTGDFGLSFAPTGRNDQQQNGNGQGQTPIQDAIKLLSLRIPQFVGAQGIAPQSLMMGEGGAGLGAGQLGGLEQYLRQLFAQMGGGGGQMPSPQVIPGIDQTPGGRPEFPQGPGPGGLPRPPMPEGAGSSMPRGGPGGAPGWGSRPQSPMDAMGGRPGVFDQMTDPGLGAMLRRR